MNPLSDYPTVRRWLYLVSFLLGLGLGGAQVGYAAANVDQPTWLLVSLAVYAFVAAGTGLTAVQNTPKQEA